MIRVAAVGDIHLGVDSTGSFRPRLARLGEQADLLLLAGDLTKRGTPEEARVVAEELSDLPVPAVAVLGNHDFESDAADTLVERLRDGGVRVLEGESATWRIGGCSVGVAGVKGFGSGFPGRSASAFGEPEMKAFVHHSEAAADRLAAALDVIKDADLTVALMHYAPVEATLEGEPCEIYPFLGSYLLAEAVDACGATLAIHGHAHAGSPAGTTPGGVAVRNVALPVIQRSYQVFSLDNPHAEPACLEGSRTA